MDLAQQGLPVRCPAGRGLAEPQVAHRGLEEAHPAERHPGALGLAELPAERVAVRKPLVRQPAQGDSTGSLLRKLSSPSS